MARILSRIPNAVKEIIEKYDITLGIYNKTTNYDITYEVGTDYISTLEHGTYEEILEQLQTLRLEILDEYKKKTESGDEIEYGKSR